MYIPSALICWRPRLPVRPPRRKTAVRPVVDLDHSRHYPATGRRASFQIQTRRARFTPLASICFMAANEVRTAWWMLRRTSLATKGQPPRRSVVAEPRAGRLDHFEGVPPLDVHLWRRREGSRRRRKGSRRRRGWSCGAEPRSRGHSARMPALVLVAELGRLRLGNELIDARAGNPIDTKHKQDPSAKSA